VHRKRSRGANAGATPTQPPGSAGPANPNSSASSGTSTPAPAAAGTPAASSSPAPGEPAGEAPGSSPSGPPAPARVQVIAKEYSFTLSRPEVPAGEVIVEFINRGEDTHNLHFLEPAEGSEAGAFPNTEPGVIHDLKLKLHAGSYTLFCSLPGHEAKGMKATLIVR
jgi:plastocyanin